MQVRIKRAVDVVEGTRSPLTAASGYLAPLTEDLVPFSNILISYVLL